MSDAVKGWIRQRIEDAIRKGLMEAYEAVKVDPQNFLMQIGSAYGVPAVTYNGLFSVDMALLDRVADETIQAHMKMAAAEGAGLGLGGMFTLIPDLGILSAITLRLIQKLSLIYGFEFNTEDEMAELWIAAASAAGVDITRELLEKQLVNRFVPRVIQRIAAQMSVEVAEKWAGRLIPIISSAIGATLNYYFVRTWGERALAHFHEKHVVRREMLRMKENAVEAEAPPSSILNSEF
jgi:uncharacterized protein (DUF697 family)